MHKLSFELFYKWFQVAIDVQQNPFEKHRVAIVGECYMEALALEGLPQDFTDELRLPDLPLSQTGYTAFTLRNMSDKPYRSAQLDCSVCMLPAFCNLNKHPSAHTGPALVRSGSTIAAMLNSHTCCTSLHAHTIMGQDQLIDCLHREHQTDINPK